MRIEQKGLIYQGLGYHANSLAIWYHSVKAPLVEVPHDVLQFFDEPFNYNDSFSNRLALV